MGFKGNDEFPLFPLLKPRFGYNASLDNIRVHRFTHIFIEIRFVDYGRIRQPLPLTIIQISVIN
jgi:hypothetical protein